ncbi:error-prone DNA polymerase [Verticiella sediminum]|uniref:Error-prone DNA polymerase n=1 Tax=Verticiella sediminum TaxID=1247510 RepID=A0A556AFD6_9BURK|nr:error-prone DNA polymerase [Verticiella sediminum]TSH91590.1 error-prone DNA polymerase [Verticiella sediminum]
MSRFGREGAGSPAGVAPPGQEASVAGGLPPVLNALLRRLGDERELPDYAELQCRSNYSFLDGASHPEELVARARELGYRAIALTDECSVAGVVKAHVAMLEENETAGQRCEPLIQFVVGSSFRLHGEPESAPLELVALCQDREGYGNLVELITLARSRAVKGEYRIERRDFTDPPAGASDLSGLPNCLVILPLPYGATDAVLDEQVTWASAVFGERLWLGLCLLNRPRDAEHRARVLAAGARHRVPVVAVGDVRMHRRSCKPLLDTLAAIRLGQPVQACGYALAQNAEQHLRARDRLEMLYPPETLAESVRMARMCDFDLKRDLSYNYPEEIVPAGYSPAEYLCEQAYLGAAEKFPQGVPPAIAYCIEYELSLIAELRYEAYFLTVYDLVREARRRGILCQGRGSAANSVVCYCLGVTAADPLDTVPLFERFISKERNEPPDIDVDFEHQRREEVIQYIYQKYGRNRAALAAVVITYRSRGALRDVGKALGVDAAVIDAVAKGQQWWDGRSALLERMAEAGVDDTSPIAHLWAELVLRIHGFPRHLSQHPGGFVISRDQLSRIVPIENAAMPDRSVVQWDKDDLDAAGLLKVDVLALGMLTVLRRALAFVSAQRGEPWALHHIPPDCIPTYDMICRADTMGTFQIESRAQMSMLPRLRPREYYDLVIQVAIVRPGPIQGDMVHPYLRRRQKLERWTVPVAKDMPGKPRPPSLESALKRTLGVPIFQEQVMQIAVMAGGFSPGKADKLRRSMAAWRRKGGLEGFHDELIAGMVGNGYEREFADAIFRQMQGFGEYGFPESHAASFALLAYASAWLKHHHPQAFLAALLNSQPMGFYSPSQLVQDARRHGVRVLPVDVRYSGWEAALVRFDAPDDPCGQPLSAAVPMVPDDPCALRRVGVRLGLNQIKSLGEAAALRIEAARLRDGAFRSVADLALRAQLSRHDVQALAAADALRGLAGHRRAAAWQAADAVVQLDLLAEAEGAVVEPAPVLRAPSEAQEIVADYRALRLTLGRHPLALLRERLRGRGYLSSAELLDTPNGRRVWGCGIVVGRQRPGTAKGTVFVTLEDETGPLNVIVWPKVLETQRRALLGSRLMGVQGEWQQKEGVSHLIARRLVDLTAWLGQLETSSRDFH